MEIAANRTSSAPLAPSLAARFLRGAVDVRPPSDHIPEHLEAVPFRQRQIEHQQVDEQGPPAEEERGGVGMSRRRTGIGEKCERTGHATITKSSGYRRQRGYRFSVTRLCPRAALPLHPGGAVQPYQF